MKVIKQIIEMIFPSHCLGCQEIVNKDALFCNACWPKLQFITEPKCKICSYPFEFQGLEIICAKCLAKKPAYDKLIAIFRYNYLLKKVIQSFKYHQQTHIAKKLTKLIIPKTKDILNEAEIIAPIPLYIKRLQKRTFNQSNLIAREIMKEYDHLKLIPDLLIRIKNTRPQVELRQKQRVKNVKGAFIINPKYQTLIKGKTILLIDDITTTGATINGCAAVLKKVGSSKVLGLTIAKTAFC